MRADFPKVLYRPAADGFRAFRVPIRDFDPAVAIWTGICRMDSYILLMREPRAEGYLEVVSRLTRARTLGRRIRRGQDSGSVPFARWFGIMEQIRLPRRRV